MGEIVICATAVVGDQPSLTRRQLHPLKATDIAAARVRFPVPCSLFPCFANIRAQRMTRLARKLGGFDYFTLSFGTMIGAGWLVVMDDWLARGGPAGTALGFGVGTMLLVPVAYTYGRLVRMMPDAASEVAYTSRAFGRANLSFATGWMMTLAYIIV